MLKLRIREYSPTGVKGRILPVVDDTLEVTTQLNGTPTISFALSKIMSGKMPDDGFVVGVEYGVGNGRYKPLPQHDMFIITNYDWDDTEPTQVVRYSGMSYVIWLMGMTYLHWSEYAVNNERLWTETGHPASPGTIVGGMIYEAKLRGWGSQVSTDFTWDKDSNNVAWTADDKILQKYRLLTPITDVLESLVTGGLCDWTVEGLKLRMFRPDTLGEDKSNLVITRAESKPIKTDMSEIFTNLTVVPDEATNWLYLDNPGAPSKYGRLEATMTQSGINNHTEATKLAQPTLLKGRHTTREEAFQYHPNQGQLIPWEDFSIGDKVTVLVAGEKVTRRVIGLVAKTDQGNTSVRVIVGDPITSVSRKILARVGAASVGGIVGGSGNSFPGSTGPSPLQPEKPVNVRVTSNTAEWLPDGTAMSTIKIEWEEVTRAVDGSTAIIREYEIWSRRASEEFTRVTAVINPEATVTIWEPDVERLFVVRALSDNGQWSDWSLEVPVTPAYPSSLVPAVPANLRILSNVGTFTSTGPMATVTVAWDAVTESTDGEPIYIDEYELWDSNPIRRTSQLTASISIPSGLTVNLRVRAGSAQGVWGDLSTQLPVTGATPTAGSFAPTTPTLLTGYGDVIARWDGTYASTPSGAHSVRIEARVGTGSWTPQGMVLTAAGEALVTLGDVGDTVEVRAVSYDQLGRETGVSGTASIVIATIPGASITAGSIFVDRLAPNVGETLNIGGNAVAINLGSRVDNALVGIEQVSQDADNAQTSADNANANASAANQAVETLASGRVLAAENTIDILSGKIDNYDNSFLFLPDGLHIRESDTAKAEMVLSSAGARLIADGAIVSEWNQGQMIVSQIIAKSGQIANHIIDSSVSGHTTFRAIS